jgi:redox-sensitive bicupin YhaK (pirin superfamily)
VIELIRVLAGEAFGLRAAVRTHSPLFYAHVVLEAGASITLPNAYPERAAYVVSGAAEAEGRPITATQMAVFGADGDAVLQATAPSVIMLLGGAPVGARFIEWNFVSSSKDRIAQAKAAGFGQWGVRSAAPDPAPGAGAMS